MPDKSLLHYEHPAGFYAPDKHRNPYEFLRLRTTTFPTSKAFTIALPIHLPPADDSTGGLMFIILLLLFPPFLRSTSASNNHRRRERARALDSHICFKNIILYLKPDSAEITKARQLYLILTYNARYETYISTLQYIHKGGSAH